LFCQYAKKIVSVAKIKSLGNGSESKASEIDNVNFFGVKIEEKESMVDRVMGGYLKYSYYLFLKEFSREPIDIEDFFDGINFVYFYNNGDK
jgi:hypothetical protein